MITDRDIEKQYSLQEFVAELRRLADTLEAGEDHEIELEDETILIPGHGIFSIEHEREGGHEEIEFQISWKNDSEDDEEEEVEEDQSEESA